MNTERILALADLIEKQPHTDVKADSGFTMVNWSHDCGTPACICGWANYQRNEALGTNDWLGKVSVAAEWLGIGALDAYGLFEPDHPNEGWGEEYGNSWWEDIAPSHAAAVLRHFAKTGTVDWSVGAPE